MKKRIFAIVMEVVLGVLTFASTILPCYFSERLTVGTTVLCVLVFLLFAFAFSVSIWKEMEAKAEREATEAATRAKILAMLKSAEQIEQKMEPWIK